MTLTSAVTASFLMLAIILLLVFGLTYFIQTVASLFSLYFKSGFIVKMSSGAFVLRVFVTGFSLWMAWTLFKIYELVIS